MLKNEEELLIGAHVSIAGGIARAFERGEEIGASAIQVFTRNASRWQAKPLTADAITTFRETSVSSSVRYVAAHDSYLINLASPDHGLRKKSITTFIEEMVRCDQLGIGDLVMHPGAHMGEGVRKGLTTLADSFRSVFSEAPRGVRVLLENTAGQGTSLGARFEELAEIFDLVPQGYFAVCMDTCHAFAAGYDLSSAAGYRRVIDSFHQLLGYEKVALFHVNDCKKALGSRVDRHEHVARGYIGRAGFAALMTDCRFSAVPKIIETPGGKDHCHDLENLALLRELAKGGQA